MNNTKSKGIIAYLGPVDFPNGGAAARRILGNAKALVKAGYEVHIGSGQVPTSSSENSFIYQDLKVHSLGERTAESYPKLIKHLMYITMGSKTKTWLDNMSPKPDVVILYSGYTPYLLKLQPWCKKHKIPLIFDAVEWYEASHQSLGFLSPYQMNIEYSMRYLTIKSKNTISISSYLDKYYKKNGCNSIVVPPTLDVKSITPNLTPSNSQRLTIGYAGTPGKKDLFNNYLEAILTFDPSGERINFVVAGVTEEELLKYPALVHRRIKKIPNTITCLGKVQQSVAIRLIKTADFSVLLRPQERYANAGFPTKVVESLTMGTPVITNLTSDLCNYINDGKEGIICNDHSSASLIIALGKATQLDKKQLALMRIEARKKAEESFDFRLYHEKLALFIENADLI
ncbi:glycosyltransferase family 4 protein [Vibrio splendidus]